MYRPLTISGTSLPHQTSPHEPLVGENMNIEKPYLRLTTFPKKEDVRPLPVLIKALAHIKSVYVKSEDFDFANEQLKSVRQDLTVQSIRNEFVLDVYETHARILLEHGELNEFHQCQTMIRSLTTRPGDVTREGSGAVEEQDACGLSHVAAREARPIKPLCQSQEAADEFCGYAILYALVRNSWMELKSQVARALQPKEGATTTATTTTTTATAPTAFSASSRHALHVVKAIDDNDFRTFFRLYESAPHMSAYLMDFLVKRVRENALKRIIAAYRPSVSMEHIRVSLCFSDLEETRRFLRQHGVVFLQESTGPPPFWVDCKATANAYAIQESAAKRKN